MYINKAVEEIQISDIRKIYEKMQTYKNTINMSLGEPDIDVPQEIKQAVAYHALNTKIKYSPVGGMPKLRGKIADFYNKNFGGNFTKMHHERYYHEPEVILPPDYPYPQRYTATNK